MSENDDDNNNSKKKNKNDMTLEERIASGEFTKDASTGPLRKVADSIKSALPGFKETESPIIKALILSLTKTQKKWKREADSQMPVASGDIREIAGQPVFVPLYKLFLAYGEQFVLAIGPKKFVVVSDNKVAKEILLHQAKSFSKGLLSEILDFVMGQGLIPANGEVWKIRRKIIVPALHRKYVASMVDMFGDCGLKGSAQLARAEIDGTSVEMENFYSRLALDIIGKAVFNYDFDSLKTDDPVIKAVYTVLREAEYRSVTFIPYWKVPPLSYLVPRQRACQEALVVVNDTLNVLIERCKKNRRGIRRRVRRRIHEQGRPVDFALFNRVWRRRDLETVERRFDDFVNRRTRNHRGGVDVDDVFIGETPRGEGESLRGSRSSVRRSITDGG